jgi:hypothetical protein
MYRCQYLHQEQMALIKDMCITCTGGFVLSICVPNRRECPSPMLLCTFAWEKGLLICGAAAGAAGGATVCAVCASITELQSSPSTAAIMFSLREHQLTHG